MALRGPTSTRPGYKIPTAPVKEEVVAVETPKKKENKPTKKSGFFSPSKK